VFEGHAPATGLSFSTVPSPLRLAAKHYVWQLLNNTQMKAMWKGTGHPSVRTIVTTAPAWKAFVSSTAEMSAPSARSPSN
jgi:hypothetical protein